VEHNCFTMLAEIECRLAR